MASGIWPSVSGAAAQAQNVDIISNNLANSDTLGFKKDLPTFKEYLVLHEREQTPPEIPRGPIRDKEFYPLDGRDQSFVILDSTYTQFKQGGLRVTQSPLDVALEGQGFLEVLTPQGPRFTRLGSLKISADGLLVSTEGYPVLSSPNPNAATNRAPATTNPDQARVISLKDRPRALTVGEDGEIFAGDESIAKLSVAEFKDLKKLKKGGGQLFENRDPENRLATATQTTVRQGVLELSNVNPIEEMTNLIKANRLFEHDLKAIKTYNEMMQREANDIGKL